MPNPISCMRTYVATVGSLTEQLSRQVGNVNDTDPEFARVLSLGVCVDHQGWETAREHGQKDGRSEGVDYGRVRIPALDPHFLQE